MRGIYEYKAQGPDELAVTQGELIELSAGPSGGRNYGDGWWEGVYFQRQISLVCDRLIQVSTRRDKWGFSRVTMYA